MSQRPKASRQRIENRIVVIGNSCSGKSSLAKRLAASLELTHIELDSLHWDPNWTEAPKEVFAARVASAIAEESWVVDGNYLNVKELVWPRASLIVWLDLPLPLVLSRFFRRSILRSLKREILWNGNRESFRNNIFSRNSLLVWILTTHQKRRAEFARLMAAPPYPQLRFVQLHSAGDVRRFEKSLTKETVI